MAPSHRARVAALLADAAEAHRALVGALPPPLAESLPVDAQGLTEAIDHLAIEAGLDELERRALVRPHAVNPAVMHARVFGATPLTRSTVIASFVEGARVRADALTALADRIGGEGLGGEVRRLLVLAPPPAGEGEDAVGALRATYAAHEQAALTIAAALDAGEGGA